MADSLPPGTALLILLFQMEGLVAAVEARRLRRRAGEELIREAQAHRSAPEREMDDCLDATRLLLLSKGFVPRGLRGPLAPEEIGDRRARMAPDPPGRDVRRARIAASLARAVRRVLHPDATGGRPPALPAEEIAEAIARVKHAELSGDPELAYEVLLETLPKHYLTRVFQRTRAGDSLEQIAEEEPQCLEELRWLRWLAMHPGRRPADLPYPDLEQAEAEAARLRAEADRLTLAHAYALAYAAAEDVVTFRRREGADPLALEALGAVLAEMARVGHDLWVTEASVEVAADASVLVKRLHAGGGREVRQLGSAVYHAAKLLTLHEVSSEATEAAAITLKRAVTWVDNALTQFKMELEASQRRVPPPRASTLRRSSFSGLPTRLS